MISNLFLSKLLSFALKFLIFSPTIFLLEFCQNVEFLSLLESKENTVPAGFCDQPPSGGSRSLKPARPLKQEAGKTCLFLCPLGLATTTVVIYYIKVKFRGR